MRATNVHWIERFDMSVFAERLKKLREARNITQVRLAELLEVNPRVYNRWERGGSIPYFDTVIKIAEILQVSLDELAGRKEATVESKIKNYELHRLFKECDSLSDQDQQALIIMIDSLVKKTTINKVMSQS